METIKINIDDVSTSPELKVIDTPQTPGGTSKSVNFGAGLDLFMNNKKVSKPGSPTSDIKLNEINNLDLNEEPKNDTIKLNLDEAIPVSLNKTVYNEKVKKAEETNLNKPMLGKEMSKDENKDSDGFTKFTEIPVNPNVINVLGEVLNPVAFEYRRSISISSAISNAGGFKEYADKRRVYVIKSNGLIKLANRNVFARNVKLEVGDTIIVPRKVAISNQALQSLIPATQILSDLAFSAAAIESLQNN